MRKERGLLLAVNAIITSLLIFFDQFTKYLALTKLKGEEAIVLIQGVLELDYLENRGSAFGMFQNQKVFLLASGFVFLAFILYFMLKIPIEKKYLLIHLCLTGILAGGIGNMIDRFRFGFVVDFISFVLIHFPIFNTADCYIVVAVILLMLEILFVLKDDDLSFLSFKKSKEE